LAVRLEPFNFDKDTLNGQFFGLYVKESQAPVMKKGDAPERFNMR